jgi:hypothetical protein
VKKNTSVPVPVPVSKATNAYELLTDIMRVVKSEPKRLNMDNWLLVDSDIDARNRPACHTVACVAGWATVLVDGRDAAMTMDAQSRATELLFGGYNYASPIYQDIQDLFFTFPTPKECGGRPGTMQYARYIAKRIKALRDKYEHEFKERAIEREV